MKLGQWKLEAMTLPKGDRYLGYEQYFYDIPFHTFGFWWFNVCWHV